MIALSSAMRRAEGDPRAKGRGMEAFREYLDEYKRELLTLIAERELPY